MPNIYEKIIAAYPELDGSVLFRDEIILQNDGDGIQYLKAWNYEKPIPTGVKLGK